MKTDTVKIGTALPTIAAVAPEGHTITGYTTEMWVVLIREPLAAYGGFCEHEPAKNFAKQHDRVAIKLTPRYDFDGRGIPDGLDNMEAIWFNGDWERPVAVWPFDTLEDAQVYCQAAEGGVAIPMNVPDATLVAGFDALVERVIEAGSCKVCHSSILPEDDSEFGDNVANMVARAVEGNDYTVSVLDPQTIFEDEECCNEHGLCWHCVNRLAGD